MSICEKDGRQGLVFPATEWEHGLPRALRVVVYGFALLYSFFGVAIIADVFMASIEKVTSARTSTLQRDGRRRTTKVWNDTVATLSLMALGSSAPEIFLSVIDIVKGRFHFSSSLGASTIVGSAAFNLFVIVAVCIMAIPAGEGRIVKNLPAFYVTALFSIAAYLWMGFILLYSSPQVVHVWEAVLTFALLPALIYVSYKVDRGDADGLLRMLHIISVYDEVLAAEPARRVTQRWGLPRPSNEDAPMGTDFTVVWHSRNSGWQAVVHSRAEEAQATYARIPLPDSRAIFAPDGDLVKSWFLNREWAETIKTYFASLKGGNYLKFTSESLSVPAAEEAKTLSITVSRHGSLGGAVSCDVRAEPLSAVPGLDYECGEGRLEFAPGEAEKRLEITVPPRSPWRRATKFLVILEDCDDGVKFDPLDDGGTESAILTVILEPVQRGGTPLRGFDGWLALLDRRVVDIQMLRLGAREWVEQLGGSVYVLGGPEEQRGASPSDWALHLLCLPWKVLVALLPPTGLFGGWFTFWTTLAYLAVITACVSDLAELFGCVLGAPNIVTAISFVALGTSMPDLFASLTAAKEDPTADASVVNVTGSNSVNVFLGLGVPWSLAAIYWQVVGRTEEWESLYPDVASSMEGSAFVVESNNLGHSVLVFCVTCSAALVLLHLRRKWLGAELGGPRNSRYAVAGTFVVYWLLFMALVSWRVLRWGQPGYTDMESAAVHGASLAGGALVTAVSVCVMKRDRLALPGDSDGGVSMEQRRNSTASSDSSAEDRGSVVSLDKSQEASDTDPPYLRDGADVQVPKLTNAPNWTRRRW